MSESNFAITEALPKKEKQDTKEKPLASFLFIRQRSGMKAVRQRKKEERRAMNKMLHAPRKAKKDTKKNGVTDNIQRGFDLAKKWREE